jgi:hypothetical protein
MSCLGERGSVDPWATLLLPSTVVWSMTLLLFGIFAPCKIQQKIKIEETGKKIHTIKGMN